MESNSLNISFLDQNLSQWEAWIEPGDQSQPSQINLGHARRGNGECFWNSIWKFSNLCIWDGLLEKFFIHPVEFFPINFEKIHFIQVKAAAFNIRHKWWHLRPSHHLMKALCCEIFTGSQPHTSPVSASNFITDQSLLKLFKTWWEDYKIARTTASKEVINTCTYSERTKWFWIYSLRHWNSFVTDHLSWSHSGPVSSHVITSQ